MQDDDRILDLVAQWDSCQQNGEDVPADVLCADCPELRAALQEYIDSVKATAWLLDTPEVETLPDRAAGLQSDLSLPDFLKCLVKSGLVTEKEVAALRPDLHDAATLAAALVDDGQLTLFQARLLCDGKCSGHVLGDYVILDEIGAGGMGQVRLAQHRRMNRIVALKILPQESMGTSQTIARFQREVEAAAILDHPNIVTAYDAGEAGGVHFLVMQYVDGRDLMTVVSEDGPLSAHLAVDYIRQAAVGLAYAHDQGVIHRDVKPANLLVDNRGRVQILDMGLARLEEIGGSARPAKERAALTQAGTVMGTVDFMSPEQALNAREADGRADIYSLGCTLYFLMTGMPPYRGDSLMARMLAHRDDPIPDLPPSSQISEELRNAYRRSMAKNVGERYQTMRDFLTDLSEIDFRPSAEVATQADALEDARAGKSVDTASIEVADTVIGDRELAVTSQLPKEVLGETVVIESQGAGELTGRGRGPLAAWVGVGRGLGVVMVLGLVLWAVNDLVVRFSTKNGTIEIHANVADFQVDIDNQNDVLTVVDPSDKTKVTVDIPPGARKLRVRKGGFEAKVPEFAINSIDGSIRVQFVKSPPPDKSLRFDGVDDFVVVNDLPTVEPNEYTLELWVKPTEFGDGGVFSWKFEEANVAIVQAGSRGGWCLAREVGNQATLSYGGPIEPNKWHHLCAVMSRGKQTLYINGARSEASFSFTRRTGVQAEHPGTARLGATWDVTTQRHSHFAGLIDDVTVSMEEKYKADFSPPETAHFDDLTLLCFPCDEIQEGLLVNSAGDAHAGHVVGAVNAESEPVRDVAGAPRALPDVSQQPRTSIRLAAPRSHVALPLEINEQLRDLWTVEAWVKPTQVPSNSPIVRLDPGLQLKVSPWSKYEVIISAPQSYGAEYFAVGSPAPLAVSMWCHIACTSDGKEVRFFHNGKLVSRARIPFADRQTPREIAIGSYPRNRLTSLRCELDEVRISNSVRYTVDFEPRVDLSADDETVCLYKCDTGEGTTLIDSSKNAFHGKIQGATWIQAP